MCLPIFYNFSELYYTNESYNQFTLRLFVAITALHSEATEFEGSVLIVSSVIDEGDVFCIGPFNSYVQAYS